MIAAALLWLSVQGAIAAQFLQSYHWTFPKPYFGGWSGIDLSDDGNRIVAIGDNGQVIDGTIRREDGRIAGVDFPYVGRLLKPDGERVSLDHETDSEGLTFVPGGGFCVSFEDWARVWCYEDWLSKSVALPREPDFETFDKNGGMEALAAGPDGALYTMAEDRAGLSTSRAVYRYRDRAWAPFGQIDVPGAFRPVGADIGPDGRFYLLERRYFPVLGFSTRVVRYTIGATGLEGGETLIETGLGTHDNLEGIAVWRDDAGRIRLTMVSDDNFSRFQRTEIVEYALP